MVLHERRIEMNYQTVGKTGIKDSELAFGTMSFGSIADKEESKKMFDLAVAKGINFFDSANVYGGGKSEAFLGEFIAEKNRAEFVLTTKAFWPTSQNVNASGLSRKNIIQSVEDSLKRLQTDYIDFYFVHDYDPNTPVETTLDTLDQLVKEGKILHPAVSNWSAWQMAKALGIQSQKLLSRFELVEPMYSLVKRQAEVEILPFAKEEQLGVISYSPLGGGLLTGKYRHKEASGRLIDDARYAARYGQEQTNRVAEEFTDFAAELGISPVTLAIAWVKKNPAVTAPIIGARNTEQLQPSLAALDYELTDDIYQKLNELSITPQPATDRGEVLTGKFS